MTWWESFIINGAISIIKSSVKNPAHAANLKVILLSVRDDINAAYPGE